MNTPMVQPSPMLFFETANAYQRTAALKAAVELGVFTAIGNRGATALEVAARCQAAERGIRILCDYLTIVGFLIKVKEGEAYSLTPDSALFLDQSSRAYLGGSLDFLLSSTLTTPFENLAASVRAGGAASPEESTVVPEHPVWVKFARAMMPLMAMPAQQMVEIVPVSPNSPLRVLDIAAGHGLFGISFAQKYPKAEIVAQDWPAILEVAKQNAASMGVGNRYSTLPGSAFDVDFGIGYDLVLLTNFLHHFDPETNEKLLRKTHSALKTGGRAITLEFVPNEDRVSPPGAAMFALMMLGTTPRGDAYTFAELDSMFRIAGFSPSEVHDVPAGVSRILISPKS